MRGKWVMEVLMDRRRPAAAQRAAARRHQADGRGQFLSVASAWRSIAEPGVHVATA